MLYFTFSDFIESFTLNNYFSSLNMSNPDIFKVPLRFTATAGNFPYNYWDGSHCNMLSNGYFINDIIHFITHCNIPIRFQCNNLFLQEQDFHDIMNNLIFDEGKQRNNQIELSNLQLLEYLETHYNNFKFVFSKYAHYMTEFTPDLLNNILSFNKFELIQLPDQFIYNKQFLQELTQRNKIEVSIGTICPIVCQNFDSCIIRQHQNQYQYSRFSSTGECDLTKNKISALSIEELQEFYTPLGINHFIIPSLANSFTYLERINFYIQYFIKPEYQYKILIEVQNLFGKEIYDDQFHYTRAL